jgi:hypothetical protein
VIAPTTDDPAAAADVVRLLVELLAREAGVG